MGYSLLIVEDDEQTRLLDRRLIDRKFPDLAIFEAENGSAALEMCRRHRPQIILTTLPLPVSVGIRMVQEIRGINPDARFILLTANSESAHAGDLADAGIDQFLQKPVDLQDLFAAVQKAVDEIAGRMM